MTYLLDTHTVLWFLSGSTRLSEKSQRIISDTQNECYISMASLWEISIKQSLGKIKLDVDFKELAETIVRNDITLLIIAFDHLVELNKLPYHHRDPFDRLIIAQAVAEGHTIITKDKYFKKYDLPVLWN